MLGEKEAETIDDWGFANRIRTRAEAIRRLCKIGLNKDQEALEILASTVDCLDVMAEGRYRDQVDAAQELFMQNVLELSLRLMGKDAEADEKRARRPADLKEDFGIVAELGTSEKAIRRLVSDYRARRQQR